MPVKMVAVLGASTVLWILFAVSQAFKIEISPEYKTIAQIGDSMALTCSTTGCESPLFSWRTQIDSPLNAKVRTEGSKSVLTMEPVSFENEHSYLCTATCGSGKLERSIHVDIYFSPRNTTISVHPSTRLQEGGAVTMTCSSEGLPAPEIFWGRKLDNEVLQLLSGNATLTLIAMRMEDSGVYVCEGVNLIGRDKAEVELVVQDGRMKSQITNGHQLTVHLMFAKSFYFICYLCLYLAL